MQLTSPEFEDVGFFEGTEKLLEVWFSSPKNRFSDEQDLRRIPRFELDSLLDNVKAEIVSYTSNAFIDSYVLSESSMFISTEKFIIKTCGTTKLLNCMKPLIQLAKQYSGYEKISNIFYSRRVYLEPKQQCPGHQTFQEEVCFLENFFPGGKSYVLGQTKGEEWYLFAADYEEVCTHPDVTLEILMSDLDEKTMLQFTKARYPKSTDMTEYTGIADIIPESIHDGLAFDPCGYSMNGLLRDTYHTIHITPQPQCSYVSFETNLQLDNYNGLINKVVKTFKPRKFIITLFANKLAPCGSALSAFEKIDLKGYRCMDREGSSLNNYSLSYGHFKLH